jgi:protein-tyrosine kinase
MDSIRKALERARTPNLGGQEQPKGAAGSAASLNGARQQFDPGPDLAGTMARPLRDIALDGPYLESRRIIAHDKTDPRAKSFDMLRTQVLQAMDQKGWRLLGVTSPTPGCGKTVTAINLALSIARQPERTVLLMDLDLQKPQIANYLGLKEERSAGGVVSVLDGRADVSSAIVSVHAGDCRAMVLPAESPISDSSARMTSRAMSELLQQIKRTDQACTVILDLPPMLSSDDVIAILPQLDCVLLVAAFGRTTVAELAECNRHLQSGEVLRLVLNKVPDSGAQYYYSSRSQSG